MTYHLIFFTMALTAFAASSRATQRTAFLVFVIPLFLFVGTREWTGCDFFGYLRRFEFYNWVALQNPDLSVSDVLFVSEGGFNLINFVLVWNGAQYYWLNIVCAAIFFFCLSAFALRRERAMALLAVFFPIMIVQLAMSGIRQATAAAVLLLAWNAFSDRKPVRMALFIFAASLFHISALMFLPLVFAVGRDLKPSRIALGLLITTPVAIFVSGERVDVYVDRYGDGEVESFGAVLRVALIAVTATFFEIYRKEFRRLYPEDYQLMRIFSLIGFSLVAIVLVSSIAAHRIGYYVMPVHLLTLVRLPRAMAAGRREPLLEGMPFVAYGLYIVVWFSISRHADICYTPYDSYLF